MNDDALKTCKEGLRNAVAALNNIHDAQTLGTASLVMTCLLVCAAVACAWVAGYMHGRKK